MDSFSGSFPLEFISFYLDMSSEEHKEIVPATTTGTLIEEEVPQRHDETAVSQATATLKDAESKQPEAPKDNSTRLTQLLVHYLIRVQVTDIVSEAGFSVTKADCFQTDTCDIEELLDSSGAETAKESPFLIAIETQSVTGSEARKETEQLTSAGLLDVSSPKLFRPTRPLSASARTLINQHFSETNQSVLPVGHATVAFNQGQVHSILRAVSTETITYSLHQMKNILEEANRVGIRSEGTQ